MEQKEKDKYFADIEETVIRDGVMIIEGMDEQLYHEFPALSSSDVKTWLGSSSQRKFELYLKFGKRATRAMEAGTVMHTVLLEGEKIWDRVVVSPYDEFRTKEAKAWRDAQTKIVLKKNEADEQYGKFFKVRDLVMADPATAALFRPDVLREVSIFVKHPTGIIKARFDLLDLENDAICDVKTTQDASADGFFEQSEKFRYGVQQEFYRMVARMAYGRDFSFRFLAVEMSEPNDYAIRTLPGVCVPFWTKLIDSSIQQIAACVEADRWLGYEHGEARMPAWAVQKYRSATILSRSIITTTENDGGGNGDEYERAAA